MKENGKVRTIWLRILGYFLMGMLLLTILSRAADSIMLPAVKTARPLPGALTHTVILNGTVEAKELYPVIATDGMIVTKVHVRAGQQIKAGDTLSFLVFSVFLHFLFFGCFPQPCVCIILDGVSNKFTTSFCFSLLLGHGLHFLSGFKCFPSLRKGLGCFPQPCDYIITRQVSNKFTTCGVGQSLVVKLKNSGSCF